MKLRRHVELYQGEVDGEPVLVVRSRGPHAGHPKVRTIGADVRPSEVYRATKAADMRKAG